MVVVAPVPLTLADDDDVEDPEETEEEEEKTFM